VTFTLPVAGRRSGPSSARRRTVVSFISRAAKACSRSSGSPTRAPPGWSGDEVSCGGAPTN
jgi:hypothetical protein